MSECDKEKDSVNIPPSSSFTQIDDDMELSRLKSPRMEELESSPSPKFSPEVSEQEENQDGSNFQDAELHQLRNRVILNPVVLKSLFSLCSTELLATFRQVCKLWHDTSLSYWRSSVCVPFNECMFYKDKDEFWTLNGIICEREYVSSLHKFLEFNDDPKNMCEAKPYRNFSLKKWEFTKTSELIDMYWLACANTITSLELNMCTFDKVDTFRKVIYKCPNLEQLVLKDYKIRTEFQPVEGTKWVKPEFGEQLNLKSITIDMDHEPFPVSWLELLSHFPAITTLNLYNADLEYPAIDKMLTAISIIKKTDKRKLCLKHLDILSASLYAQETVPTSVCDLLLQLQFPLESLTIDFGVETPIQIVKDILEVHAKTLKMINAYRGPISDPYKNFPFGVKMDKMEKFYTSDRLCDTIEFVKLTPNLKILHIRDVVEDRPPHIATSIIKQTLMKNMVNVTLPFVTELRLDYLISNEDVAKLTIWMPNIERLRMILNDSQFATVCGTWTKITFLHVGGVELTDDGITGMDLRNLDGEVENPELAKPVLRPNITLLKSLTRFKMDNEDILPTKLGDASVYHGFLKLDNLQDIRICSQMGEKAREALYEKVPDCEIVKMVYNEVERWWDAVY